MKTNETTNAFKRIRDAVQNASPSGFPPELPTTALMAVTLAIGIFVLIAITI